MKTYRYLLLLTFCIIYTGTSTAQCDCGKDFSFLQAYIEKNYSGYNDKIPTYGDLNYKEYTTRIKAKAAKEKNNTYCMYLMKEWLKYFKDLHLHIINAGSAADSAVMATRIKNTERMQVSPQTLEQIKKESDVTGIYYNDDSTFKVAIVKDANSWRTYAAVVLETKSKGWQPGMVKFELKPTGDSSFYTGGKHPVYNCIYYNGNHEAYTNKTMSFSGYGLDGGIWKKAGLKESEAEQSERNKWKEKSGNNTGSKWSYLEFKKPAPGCAYLRISSFDGKYMHEIDSFVRANDTAISHARYLIIDVRGNGGGSDASYGPLIPYLYTKPIVYTGMSLRATQDNIDATRRDEQGLPEEIRKALEADIAEMKKYIGRFTPAKNDTLVLSDVKKFPEKVAILINGDCASTTEEFLLTAKQSDKVTLMGMHTSGTLDYSNDRTKQFPCIPYTLEYPITRSGRLPDHGIDNIGIQPDIVLEKGADWVTEAVIHFKSAEPALKQMKLNGR